MCINRLWYNFYCSLISVLLLHSGIQNKALSAIETNEMLTVAYCSNRI